MYICIYVYMYIYIYVCIHVYMYICIHVYMYICIYVYMYILECLHAKLHEEEAASCNSTMETSSGNFKRKSLMNGRHQGTDRRAQQQKQQQPQQ